MTVTPSDGLLDGAPTGASASVADTPPVATDGRFDVVRGQSFSGTLSVTDVDNEPMVYFLYGLNGPFHGTLTSLDPYTGAFTYQADSDYVGMDQFLFGGIDLSAEPRAASLMRIHVLAEASILSAGALTPPVAAKDLPFSGTVFHFSDSDAAAQASDFTATVQTGDGQTLTSSANPLNVQVVANASGGFDVQLSYTYARRFRRPRSPSRSSMLAQEVPERPSIPSAWPARA